MDDFLVAGSTSGESDERTLNQVVQIAGYTSTIRALVQRSFRFCHVHGALVPKSGSKARHASCPSIKPVSRAAAPRAGLR